MDGILDAMLVKETGGYEQIGIKDELEVYYDLIQCDTIDLVTRTVGGQAYAFVVDDDGRLFNRMPTVIADDGEVLLVGNVVILRRDGSELASLTEGDVENIVHHMVRVSENGRLRQVLVAGYR